MMKKKSADTSASVVNQPLFDNQSKSRGILIANLGSPKSPSIQDIRSYLNEFLMDRHVIDLPWILRRIIVSAFVLPRRPKRSALAYEAIWEDTGSPLISNTKNLAENIQKLTGIPTVVGMRYGSPSLSDALNELKLCDEILLVPLYPQYANSTRKTTIEKVRSLSHDKNLYLLAPYYSHPDYIEAMTTQIKNHITPNTEHLLLSFHGLPERHLTKADPTGHHCLQSNNCCSTHSKAHDTCYRHQCLETARFISEKIQLPTSLSFQSRLGKLPWLKPYTDDEIKRLAKSGIHNIAVACPAFAVDNLETLEEIGIRGRELFIHAGGTELKLIPSLNNEPHWVSFFADWLKQPVENFETL